MTSKVNTKILLLLIIFGVFGIASAGFALELAWPQSPNGTQLTDNSTLPQLIQYLYEWGIAIGGLATFIAILSSGFDYLTSAGDTTKMGDARKRIQSSVMGLILLLSSWLILNTINPELTTFGTLSFDISDVPGISGTTFVTAPPCEKVELYNDVNYQGSVLATLDKNNTGKDFTLSAQPASAKAFYTKPTGEKHCNYGVSITTDGSDCTGTLTCDIGEPVCETGPAGGGCMLQLAPAGGFIIAFGCGSAEAYIPATDPNFSRWTDIAVNCVTLTFPQ